VAIIVGGDGVEFLRLICSDSTLTSEATLDTNAAGRAQSKTLTQSVDYFAVWGTSCARREQSSTNSFHSRSLKERETRKAPLRLIDQITLVRIPR
jgi:hypothetical protein